MNAYLFGPVPSRRLGRSLGVDLMPSKTCSFDCIYCQLGRATCRTIERRAYVPVEEVIKELTHALAADAALDYVTLSGSGEPTLHSSLDQVVRAIRAQTTIPVAILTNGSLLHDQEVRDGCALADVVLPTLAAHDEAGYQRIHRPAGGLSFEQHVAGLLAFRREHETEMWLELFLLEGLNASGEDIEAFSGLLERIGPERIQLNTAVRPVGEATAVAVSSAKLEVWARRLGPRAEVIAERNAACSAPCAAVEQDVLQLCRRRPCTLDDISATLGLHKNEAAKYVTSLTNAGLIQATRHANREFYAARDLSRKEAH